MMKRTGSPAGLGVLKLYNIVCVADLVSAPPIGGLAVRACAMITCFWTSVIAALSLSAISAGPESTSRTPSGPMDAVTLEPPAENMKIGPRMCITSTPFRF